MILCPIHEHGDPTRPGPYPHGQGQVGMSYVRPTPIRTSDIGEALRLMAQGKVVELPDVRSVNTLLRKLGEMALDAKAKGQQAPNYNLCNVSVPGTNLFCAEHKNVSRRKMPQFGGEPVPGSPADKLPRTPRGTVDGADAFLGYVRGLGIATAAERVPAAKLKSTQRTLEGVKVAEMMAKQGYDPAAKRIFISRDGYVVDGHHRWAAVVGLDAEDGKFDTQMSVVRIDAPISEILLLAGKWTAAFGIRPKGSD